MSWIPQEIPIDHRITRQNMAKRAIDSDETPSLTVFNKEDGSNHVDAAIRSYFDNQLNNKVTVNIEIKEFAGEEKRALMENLGFDESLRKHLSNVYKTPRQREIKENPDTIFDDETVITCLYSQDVNAVGLTGPEFDDVDIQNLDVEPRFIGYLRSDGANYSSHFSNQGTNGIGKTVLWKNSDYSCNMVYSNLSQPYTDEKTGIEIQKRFGGLFMLIDHRIDNKRYGSDIYFGRKHEGHNLTFSFWNGEAEDFAEKLHFPSFGNKPGTCSMVLGFNSGDENIENNNQLFDEIINNYSMYFWPAIIKNKMEVNVKYKNRQETVNPKSNYLSKHYVKLYQGIVKNPSDENMITVQTPKFKYMQGDEEETVPASDSVMALAVKPFDIALDEKVNNRYAIMRGSNIVVSYELFNKRSVDSNNIGLVLAGTAVPESVNGYNSEKQNTQEKLISLAEPVAHDKWTHEADNLPRGTKATVKRIITAMKKKINRLTIEVESVPISNAETLISKFLSFGTKGSGKPSRKPNLHFKSEYPMEIIRIDNIPYYEYPVEVKAPASRKLLMLQGNRRPTHFGVKIEMKPRDEFGAGIRVSEIKMKCVEAETVEISDGTQRSSRVPLEPNESHYTGEYKSRELTHRLLFRSEPLEDAIINEKVYNKKIIFKEG